MSAWFKTNKPVEGSISSEVRHALHTMQDDLSGNPSQGEVVASATEPPASFNPDPGRGAPFYTAASASESASVPPGGTSPFLGGVQEESLPHGDISASTQSDLPESPAPSVAEGEDSLPLTGDPGPSPQAYRKKKIILVGSISLVFIALLGGGAYYYFTTREVVSDAITPPSTSSNTPPSQNQPILPAIPEKVPPRFSTTQPNFLSIETETVTADGLRRQLLETAAQVKEDGLSGAVEFLVRDQNYNPLAFSRFSYLAQLTLPDTLLSQMEEAFSLYIVLDQGRPRLGMAISVKDQNLFQAELIKAEKSLPQAFSPLFIDTTTAPKTGLVFKSGAYNGLAVRYTNVDSALFLSIDYATREQRFMVGTSKDTLRAIIDKENIIPSALPTGTKSGAQ